LRRPGGAQRDPGALHLKVRPIIDAGQRSGQRKDVFPDDKTRWTERIVDVQLNSKLGISQGGEMAEPTYEELKAKVEELEKKTLRRTGELDFKVGEKGGVSVYGLGRFPVTLYYEQWMKLFEATPRLREFLEENKSRLKLKEK
jgi:hypothetical protein